MKKAIIASATVTIIVLLGSCYKVLKSIEKDLHETKPYPTEVQIGKIDSGIRTPKIGLSDSLKPIGC